MKKNITCLIIALAFVSSAQAATVTFDGDTATGILDLDVDGTFYNVTFTRTTGADLYGPYPNPVFQFPDVASTNLAQIAAVDELLTTTTQWVGESDAAADHSRTFFIGYDVYEWPGGVLPSNCAPDDECIVARNGAYQDFGVVGWKALGESEWLQFGESQIYADFESTTLNPVPVPAAVWLFGTALVGFIGVSRRRKVA
jgi:hypothetical protein